MLAKTYQSAMNMLARREHSVFELTRKLQQKDFPHEMVNEVIERLVADNLLSDEHYAEAYVRIRSARGFGLQRIRLEMKERGVTSELISDAIEQSDVDWFTLASDVRDKKFGEQTPQEVALRAKQIKFLQYRGFSHAQINAAVTGLED
ncbi:MAG: regulatory protein RecX [Sulfuriflexus sp.]|nr:regulatory protein RecX [Sulfuriflexus sp.]